MTIRSLTMIVRRLTMAIRRLKTLIRGLKMVIRGLTMAIHRLKMLIREPTMIIVSLTFADVEFAMDSREWQFTPAFAQICRVAGQATFLTVNIRLEKIHSPNFISPKPVSGRSAR
jgi:hypothetical protein